MGLVVSSLACRLLVRRENSPAFACPNAEANARSVLISGLTPCLAVEAVARVEDSETGSSAERFTEQPLQPQTGEEDDANTSVQDAEPAGHFLVASYIA